MKRFISALLAVVMVLSMVTVSAVAWTAPATFTNTSDLYDTDASTLYAVKGTPTIDGTVDAAWANAYTLRLDRSQMTLMGGNYAQSTLVDIYMMWDETNLYILEDHNYATPMYNADAVNFWSASSATCFYINLPTAWTDDGTNNDGSVNMVNVLVGDTSAATVADGRATMRTKYFTNNDATQGDIGFTLAPSVTTKTAITSDHSYVQETAIPWDLVNDYSNFTVAKDAVIGLIVHIKQNFGGNGMHKTSNDASGFQQLKLVEGTNPTVKPIIPDFTWWNTTDKTFTINTAAQLLGLVEISQRHGASTLANKLGITSTVNFKGYTFNLGADITFNAGTTFNADGTWTGNAPVNGWGTINDFFGTLNGNNKTISGMYVPNGYNAGQDVRYIGLFGRVSGPTVVKDLTLTNGFMYANPNHSSKPNNQAVGSIGAVLHHAGGAGTFTIHNVTSDLHVAGTEFAGGIIGSTYTTSGPIIVDVDNVTFTGTVKDIKKGGGCPIGAYAGRDGWSNTSGVVNNFYGPEGLAVVGSHNNAIVYTFSYDADATDAKIQSTTVANDKFDVRLLGILDDADLAALDAVGMEITISVTTQEEVWGELTNVTKNYNTVSTSTTTVYTTVNANGTDITAESLGGDAAYGAVVTNLPAAAGTTVVITVKLTQTTGDTTKTSDIAWTATYVAGVLQTAN